MRFGAVPLSNARGAILAHSVQAGTRRLRKGLVLGDAELATLHQAGIDAVNVARLEPGEIGEDDAARRIAEATGARGLRIGPAATGRCNLHAEAAGLLRVDAAAVTAANAVDEALTLATPPDYTRLGAGQLAATAKVIPYGARKAAADEVCTRLAKDGPALALKPFRPQHMALLTTRIPGQRDSALAKGIEAVRRRIVALGSTAEIGPTIAHERTALCEAIGAAMEARPELLLVLAGSATSDREDVAPGAIADAGGVIERFGMPVDPGNLLVLARIGETPAIVLPGCARSPALNGADWVLERLAARIAVTSADIAQMGVGGLLKEIPSRPQPRERVQP